MCVSVGAHAFLFSVDGGGGGGGGVCVIQGAHIRGARIGHRQRFPGIYSHDALGGGRLVSFLAAVLLIW